MLRHNLTLAFRRLRSSPGFTAAAIVTLALGIGAFDAAMDRHGYGIAGNLAVVAMRLFVSTLVAAALWYGFESQILKLKKYF